MILAPFIYIGLMFQSAQRPAKRPWLIDPCIPTRANKPPAGPKWIHEIKHDGYRLIARKRDGRVRLFTRNGFDWSERYPRISAAVATLQAASVTIDGEAVWCDGEGLAIFDKLHSRAHDGEVILLRPPGDRGRGLAAPAARGAQG
jgi:ATP-dependent DNA ligase